MSDTHGSVCWTELMTRDFAEAKGFYGDVCGWVFEDVPMSEGTYTLGMMQGRPVIGMMDMTGVTGFHEVPAHWFSYFAVDDVDASVARTRQIGGQIIREPFDVPGTGRIAIIQDPTGAAMGLMTQVEMT